MTQSEGWSVWVFDVQRSWGVASLGPGDRRLKPATEPFAVEGVRELFVDDAVNVLASADPEKLVP